MLPLAALVVIVLGGAASGSGASSVPSGERVLGQSVLEPVYNDENAGQIGYVMTPLKAPDPVKSNPRSWSPFFLPVYPVGSTVGPLLCEHNPPTNTPPADNCPTHGDLIAGLAASIMPAVYGSTDGVLGHDHLMDFPGGTDFNIAWEPVLVLFTSKAAANEHILTDAQIDAAVDRGDAIEVPLPPATFHCQAVPARLYNMAKPLT
jgi:hypothetical protein